MGGVGMAKHMWCDESVQANPAGGGVHRALQGVREQVIADPLAGARMEAMAGRRKDPEPLPGEWRLRIGGKVRQKS
jgi:hypothetical protein